jgi:hypothetical protein
VAEAPVPYWPHLAVAYATGAGHIASVDLSLLRLVTGLTWRVDAVASVELRRSPRRDRLNSRAHAVPVRGARTPRL